MFREAVFKTKFALHEEQVKIFNRNAIILSSHAFGLAPKVFDPIDMIVLIRKELGMINPIMFKFGDIQGIVGSIAVGIHHTVRLEFLPDNG